MADLRAAWDYIEAENEAAADRTIDRIQAAAEHLQQWRTNVLVRRGHYCMAASVIGG